MYLKNEALLSRIQSIAAEAATRSQQRIAYEEYIALPYFGQIILRFTLSTETVTLDELDRYESLLYEIVGDEFLIDFMGSVYRSAGVDYSRAEATFSAMAAVYAEESVFPSLHADGIRRDAALLLKSAGLPVNAPVWEIQIGDDEMLLLLLGEQHKSAEQVGTTPALSVGTVDQRPCVGLLKAAFYAKRNHVTLARLMLSAES